MKEKPKMPNLDSIVAGFAAPAPSVQSPAQERIYAESVERETSRTSIETTIPVEPEIWIAFLEELGKPKEAQDSTSKSYVYKIDPDIVATLNQCEFNASMTNVVNAILRSFILSNLPSLEKMRATSLFDKMSTTQKQTGL